MAELNAIDAFDKSLRNQSELGACRQGKRVDGSGIAEALGDRGRGQMAVTRARRGALCVLRAQGCESRREAREDRRRSERRGVIMAETSRVSATRRERWSARE
jgi:hypothetical protein